MSRIMLREQPAPPVPPVGFSELYAKEDGLWYTKNTAGLERLLGGSPFTDAAALVYNGLDNSKLLRFELGAVATATTRILTMPDANVNLGDIAVIRTDLDNFLATKGIANGFAPLNVNAKLDTVYLPDTVVGGMDYQGVWDATTNTPTLDDAGTGRTKGDYYKVSVAGATSLSGITDWNIGDWAVWNGASWDKIDNTETVTAVFGRTGVVVAQAGDYTADLIGITDAGGNYTATNVEGALAEEADAREAEVAAREAHEATNDRAHSPLPVTLTAAATLVDNQRTILADATAAAFTLTLPTAVGRAGKTYRIKKIDASVNAVTVAGSGVELIDGANTQAIAAQYNVLVVESDGTQWWIVG